MSLNPTPRGAARALRRRNLVPSTPLANNMAITRRQHDYDDDAVCVICGFDGAEWANYRASQHPDDRDPTQRAPSCAR